MPLDNYSTCTTACFIDLKRKGMLFLGLCMSPMLLPSPDLCSLVCIRLQTWGRETLQALSTGGFSLSLSFVELSGEVHLPPGITTEFLHFYLNHSYCVWTSPYPKQNNEHPYCFWICDLWNHWMEISLFLLFFFSSYALFLFKQGDAYT